MAGHCDGGKLKAAQDALLDRIAAALDQTSPAAIKDLAEAFALLENASKSK
jgi:hypothetical protein